MAAGAVLMMPLGALQGVLDLAEDGRFIWSDDGSAEASAQPATLRELIATPPAIVRHGVRCVVLSAAYLDALPEAWRAVVADVCASGRYGPVRLEHDVRRQGVVAGHAHVIAADAWGSATAVVGAVRIPGAAAVRVLERVRKIELAAEAARQVDGELQRCVDRFYRRWQPWGLYRASGARAWAVVEAAIAERYRPSTPAYIEREAALWRAVDADFLLTASDAELRAFALAR